ncbi:MAG TPA: DNA-binding protein [Candidatus Nanoarchaeia archaeon]|nr:DNA-binding protein [Candidatus Nanoarchaeia archaeon]
MNEEYQEALKKQAELQQQIEMLENLAKQYMTREAITRYGTVKTAHPELALRAATLIVQAAKSSGLRERITDEQFKDLLRQLQQPRKETKIRKI